MGKVPSENKYYVVIEKLNSKKFEEDWDKLELALEDVGAVDVDKGENFTTLYIIDGTSSEKFIEIGQDGAEIEPMGVPKGVHRGTHETQCQEIQRISE